MPQKRSNRPDESGSHERFCPTLTAQFLIGDCRSIAAQRAHRASDQRLDLRPNALRSLVDVNARGRYWRGLPVAPRYLWSSRRHGLVLKFLPHECFVFLGEVIHNVATLQSRALAQRPQDRGFGLPAAFAAKISRAPNRIVGHSSTDHGIAHQARIRLTINIFNGCFGPVRQSIDVRVSQ